MLPSYLFFIMLLPLALSKIDCNLNPSDPETEDDDDDDIFACDIYRSLATDLLKDDRNFYNLQNIFFPPNDGSPVFVAVKYRYFEIEDDNDTMSITFNTTYFWSSSVYFFFHPVRVLQFSSLLLSDPSLRYGEINLFLPEHYFGAHNDCMVLLTQRVSQKLIPVPMHA
jgi:hypothetical protein